MNAFMFPVFDYIAKNRWLQIVLGLGVGWLLIMFYLWARDSGVRKQARLQWEAENEREHARTVETVNEIGQETGDAKDRAIAAPDAVTDVSSADELRERYPDNAKVILRPRPSGSGQGS